MTDLFVTSPVSRQTLADSAYGALLEAIVSGRLPSGSVLTTVDVANKLRISRTPAQEALRRLAADGLVELSAGKRAKVVEFSRREVQEVYEIRMLLEGECAARVASLFPIERIQQLRFRLEELLGQESTPDWCLRALECDSWFHSELAAAVGNRRLQEDIERYRLLIRSFCRIVGTVENLRNAILEHLEVITAIEKQNPETARTAMQRHIQNRLKSVLDVVGDREESV